MADNSIKDLIKELAEERGVDLRGYKVTTLERRVNRRMQQLGLASYVEYLAYIRTRPAENTALLNTVLINVTRFFRDPPAWELLEESILPALFKDRPPGSSFRVWCAGCATGEEAYSIAILLFNFLGARTSEFDIKIYATDNDDEALSAARQAQYPAESLRGMRPEFRAKYFTGDGTLRVARDVRRLVIFGQSNLLTDAPISHVDLLLCRNVLIYFDAAAQSHIMGRLKYALNESGILFLGKSETQLKRNTEFIPVNARWRIFQRRSTPDSHGRTFMDADLRERAQHELQTLRLYYGTILETLEPGVLVLNASDTVITENDKIQKLWELSEKLAGKKLHDSQLWERCPELRQHLETSKATQPKTVRFDCQASPSTVVTVTIRPIMSESGTGRVGTLIYAENITPRVTLQNTIEELETTGEELQSTNEELQSTNEELETTNEELQSTNEELETTNEELQSLNEELETTNEELSSRTRELDEVNARYSEMLERMPWPVFLVDNDARIHMFNSAAQKFFGFAQPSAKGMALSQLPLDGRTRQVMARRLREVVRTRKQSAIRDCPLVTNRFSGIADIYFTPLVTEDVGHAVIVMFQVNRQILKRPAPKPKARGGIKKQKISNRKKKH